MGMTQTDTPNLTEAVRQILDGPHLAILATASSDGRPQTSAIFVMRESDEILFSTIKGRQKMTNLLRNPRVSLLAHRMPIGSEGAAYATISGTVTLTDDPGGSFHEVMYGRYMGGAKAPSEPGAERVTVRIRPERVYVPPVYRPALYCALCDAYYTDAELADGLCPVHGSPATGAAG
jgi:PPOX class probable F420-dependent enzyme